MKPDDNEAAERRESLSYAEIAAANGVTTRTVRRWRALGRFKSAFNDGRRITRLVPAHQETAA